MCGFGRASTLFYFILYTLYFILTQALAIDSMLKGRPDLRALWAEYDEGTSPEAILVHDLDRLDMALQAIRYGRIQGVETKEFLLSARKSIHHSEVAALLDHLE